MSSTWEGGGEGREGGTEGGGGMEWRDIGEKMCDDKGGCGGRKKRGVVHLLAFVLQQSPTMQA